MFQILLDAFFDFFVSVVLLEPFEVVILCGVFCASLALLFGFLRFKK